MLDTCKIKSKRTILTGLEDISQEPEGNPSLLGCGEAKQLIQYRG